MLISTLGKNGLSIMVDIAIHGSKDAPTITADVCRRLGLPKKYSEGIIRRLNKKQMLSSKAGNGGGHYLPMPAEAYTVKDIVLACERGPLLVVSNVSRLKKMARPEAVLWADLNDMVHTFMANKTLDTLIPKTTKKGKQNTRRKVVG